MGTTRRPGESISEKILGFFSELELICALLLHSTKAGTAVELPQSDNAQNSEDNLECVLKVLREFDERRNESTLPDITHLYDHIQPGVDRNIDINTMLLQFYNLRDIQDKESNTNFVP